MDFLIAIAAAVGWWAWRAYKERILATVFGTDERPKDPVVVERDSVAVVVHDGTCTNHDSIDCIISKLDPGDPSDKKLIQQLVKAKVLASLPAEIRKVAS